MATMRRRVGTGSVFKRKSDGRWIAQTSHGPRDNRVITRRVARSKREALELLAELQADAGIVDRTTTVGSYLRSWLRSAERSVKPSTLQTYEIAVRRQLEPAIGHVPLAALKPAHVEALLRGMDLTPKGQRNALGVLARALTVAERQGLVTRNVARLVDPPRVERKDIPAMTADDVRRILSTVKGDRLEALYVLALATGLRMAELLGLRWDDWDRDRATVRVAYTLERLDGRYSLVEPKTRRSRRTVALPAFAQAALEAHREAQLAERIGAGVPTQDGLVFVTEAGRPINGGWLSHHWRKVAERAGVQVTFHQLRHGSATLLAAAGVNPRVVADRLGHATTRMTLDTYTHVAANTDREAAAALDKVVNG